MFENEFLPHVLIRAYLETHPNLSDAAQSILRENVFEDLYGKRWYCTPELEALGIYAQTQKYLIDKLAVLNEETASEEEFVSKRDALFDQSTQALVHATQLDEHCVLAHLLLILLNGIDTEECIFKMIKLSSTVQEQIEKTYPSIFEVTSTSSHEDSLQEALSASPVISSNALLIGYLQINEALCMHCFASARYRKALEFADKVLGFPSYSSHMGEVKLLCLARLEDEDGFYQTVEKLSDTNGELIEYSPWYKFARTLLLYKLGKTRAALRSAKDFIREIDGGAFFTILPVFHMPYLPVHPEPKTSWELTHQAIFDAEPIINDTPDFALWFAQIEEAQEQAKLFAEKNGFDFGGPSRGDNFGQIPPSV